jgi:hypothetical protein
MDRVRGILDVVRSGPCCHTARKRRTKSQVQMEDFIFVQRMTCEPSLGSVVISAISTVGVAAIAGGSIGTAAAAAACVPIIIPMSNALIDAGIPIGDEAKKSMAHLMTVNSLQLSLGLIEFLTGDIVNGFTHIVMAGVGFYVVKLDGIVLLPSYSVASTVFAGVSALNVLEMLLYKGSPTADLTLTDNLLKVATISHPLLYAASAFIAWNLIDQLRNGLLNPANASRIGPAPDGVAPIVVEPTVNASSRAPFAGRAFRLNGDQDEITINYT